MKKSEVAEARTAKQTAIPLNEVAEIAQTEKIGLGDLVIGGSVAAITLILLTAWQYPGLHPLLWKDAIVAAEVRPAVSVMPGYWQIIATFIYRALGYAGGNSLFRILGHISMALISLLVYSSLREMLAFIMRARPQRSDRRPLVLRIASAVGAFAFVFADPVWTAGQMFSETTVLILLTLGALDSFFVFLRKGTLKYSYICAILLGLLAAESPMGLVLTGLFIGINMFVLKVMPVLNSPFFNPALIAVGKWHMTFLLLGAMVLGVGANCVSFVVHDGLSAIGEGAGYIPLQYLLSYWQCLAGAGDVLGWILFIGVGITPFLVTIMRFPSAADEDRFLPYSTGIVFLICGLVCVSQCCSLSSLWFWSYGHVYSPYMLACGNLLIAFVLAESVTILGVDSLCRNHQNIARRLFGNEEEAPAIADSTQTLTAAILRKVSIIGIPLVIVATMIPGRPQTSTREMLEIIGDGIKEIVEETEDVEYIFTDGNLDQALELESYGRHDKLHLKCLSVMPNITAMDAYLAIRGLTDDSEDVFCFRHDCGMGLRSWMRDRPERLRNAAVQIGFDLWKRDGRAIPAIGGMLSLPERWNGSDDSKRLEGIERTRKLAQRILAVYAKKGYRDCTDSVVCRTFCMLQWRIARMCIYRGERADLSGDLTNALSEVEMAKALNDNNEMYQRMMRSQERFNESLLQRLTPREGLQLALVRADFNMAKVYAETILKIQPDNHDANFAMGMYYASHEQFIRAEEYLKRALIGNSREPAVYNNLAMVQLELGKLEAASINAEKALAIIPDSDAVKDTCHRIREAIRKQRPSNR